MNLTLILWCALLREHNLTLILTKHTTKLRHGSHTSVYEGIFEARVYDMDLTLILTKTTTEFLRRKVDRSIFSPAAITTFGTHFQ
jgi:hypothetical protein